MNKSVRLTHFLEKPNALMGMSASLALVLVEQLGGENALDELVSKPIPADIVSVSLIQGFDNDASLINLYQNNKELFLAFLNTKHDVKHNYFGSAAHYVLTKCKATHIKRRNTDEIEVSMPDVLSGLYDPSINASSENTLMIEPIILVCREALLFLMHSYRYYKYDINPIELIDTFFDHLQKEAESGNSKIGLLSRVMKSAFESNQTFLDSYHDHIDGLSGIIGLNPKIKEAFFFNNKENLLRELQRYVEFDAESNDQPQEVSVIKFLSQEVTETDNLDAIGRTIYGISGIDRYTDQSCIEVVGDISNVIIHSAVGEFESFINIKYDEKRTSTAMESQ